MSNQLTLSARNAGLGDLVEILEEQHARKHDIVVPASKIYARDGLIRVKGAEQEITLDGVTTVDGTYRPTDVFHGGVATKLDIPVGYLRRLHASATDLYDANVNGWLHGRSRRGADSTVTVLREPDQRSFLLRLFKGDGGEGVARALLSDSYKLEMDNLDVLTSALQGVRDAGLEVEISNADLTERRMRVRVIAPEVTALAPVLLAGYRSPFTGASGTDNPVVEAGFDIGNSETGGGAFTITPVLRVRVCSNGMVIEKAQLRRVHLGGKMAEGVKLARDTEEAAASLVQKMARDAVRQFLDVTWVRQQIAKLEGKAATPVADAQKTIEDVTQTLKFGEQERKGILDHFIKGGQLTAGGVMQAVTSYAQTIGDPDRAVEVEAAGIRAMEAAARR